MLDKINHPKMQKENDETKTQLEDIVEEKEGTCEDKFNDNISFSQASESSGMSSKFIFRGNYWSKY